MYCVNCGFSLQPNARLCPRCGSTPGSVVEGGPNLDRIAYAIERNAIATENIYNLMLAAAIVTAVSTVMLIIIIAGILL